MELCGSRRPLREVVNLIDPALFGLVSSWCFHWIYPRPNDFLHYVPNCCSRNVGCSAPLRWSRTAVIHWAAILSRSKIQSVAQGYHLLRVLEGGMFSRIFKAVNRAVGSPDAACKVVPYAPIVPGESGARHPPNQKALQKEVRTHGIPNRHLNVLRSLRVEE